jgi:signal transduction histidine kinase
MYNPKLAQFASDSRSEAPMSDELSQPCVQAELEAELAAMKQLHELSGRLLAARDLPHALEEIVDAAVGFQGADMGSVELYDAQGNNLQIAAQRGFDDGFLKPYGQVDVNKDSDWGVALRDAKRVIVEDTESDQAHARRREAARAGGYRAMQCTPLYSAGGTPLGLLSTHFRTPHVPGERELRMLDLYAARAADVIARMQAHDELQARVALRTAELASLNAALLVEVAERSAAERRVRELLGQLVDLEEDERRRISRELHDSLGQHLSVLTIGLKAVQAIEGCPPQVHDRLGQIQRAVAALEEEVDRLSHELRPTVLDDLGLEDALRRHVEAWTASGGVAVDIHTHGLGGQRLPLSVEITAYRVVQEALTNVRKHANASWVSLIAEQRSGQLRAIVEDDGCGFDAAANDGVSSGRRRLGLKGMAERATLVGGRLQIESAVGKGTTVYLAIPLAGITSGRSKYPDA